MPISLLWILAFYFAGTLDAVGVPEMLEASEKVCPRGRNEQAHPVSHRGRGPGIRGKICRDNAGKGLDAAGAHSNLRGLWIRAMAE